MNVAGYADPVVALPEREDVPSHAVGQAEDKAEDGIRRLRAPLKRQRPEREDLAPASREERLCTTRPITLAKGESWAQGSGHRHRPARP